MNKKPTSEEAAFFENIDKWIRMPDLQQQQGQLEDKIHTLDTLLNFELAGNKSKRLYAQKSNVFFLRKAQEVVKEKKSEKTKLENDMAEIDKELETIYSSFQTFKQSVITQKRK